MEYGSLLPAGFVVPSSSFHIRKDLTSVNHPFHAVVIRPGDVVLDAGAHIGTFAAAALESGARAVHCYEAEPRNYARLIRNLEPYGPQVSAEWAALVAPGSAATVPLMLSGFTGAHSIVKIPKGRYKYIDVRAVDFRQALLTIRPDVLKVDVESAEYMLFDSLGPGDLASVSSLFIEFHPIPDRDRRIEHVRELVVREGFTEIVTRPRRYTANRRGR